MNANSKICVHATTISLNGRGVLIRGASGAGKSSLALAVLETPGTGLSAQMIKASLVSDDQTELTLLDGVVYASAPAPLEGLLEIRGQGLVTVDFLRNIPLCLVVDLKPVAEIERMPRADAMFTEILGVTFPCLAIDTAAPAAASRLRVAWAGIQKA
jgi:HPr kinase/phosphorylase